MATWLQNEVTPNTPILKCPAWFDRCANTDNWTWYLSLLIGLIKLNLNAIELVPFGALLTQLSDR